MDKSPAILDVVEALRLRLGPGSFDVVDYWPGDPHTVGVAPPGADEPCVCVLTAGKEPGRYDVEHGGKVFRNCVIDGVEWAVRHELGEQRHASPDRGGIGRSQGHRSPRRRGR